MASAYCYVLDCMVAEKFLDLTYRQRELLLTIFRRVSDDPFQQGDTSFRDVSGRQIQTRLFGQWSVSFWPDHAVKEVRIVRIYKIKT